MHFKRCRSTVDFMETKVRVAKEFGFPEEKILLALRLHSFKTAGDLVEYLSDFEGQDELERHEELDDDDENLVESTCEEPHTVNPCASVEDKSVRAETLRLYGNTFCFKCKAKTRCMLALPCSHISLCRACAQMTRTCAFPKCKEEIDTYIHVYQA